MTKFYTAMAAYIALAVTGAFLISDNRVRYCLWIFLAGMAAKTAITQFRPKDE